MVPVKRVKIVEWRETTHIATAFRVSVFVVWFKLKCFKCFFFFFKNLILYIESKVLEVLGNMSYMILIPQHHPVGVLQVKALQTSDASML